MAFLKTLKSIIPFGNVINFRSFLWSFMASFVLWLLLSLNDNFSRRISLPVSYKNVSSHKIYNAPLPERIDVDVTMRGWDILSFMIQREDYTLNIDVDEFKRDGNISSRYLLGRIQHILPYKATIGIFYPDYISLNTSIKNYKRVPIIIDSRLALPPGYGISQALHLDPDSVTVYGTREDLASLTGVKTEHILVDRIGRASPEQIILIRPGDKYTLDKTVTVLTYATEKLTEKEISLLVNPKDTGESYPLKITYLTPLSYYTRQDSAEFQFEFVPTQSKEKQGTVYQIQIKKSPPYTERYRLKPEFIVVE